MPEAEVRPAAAASYRRRQLCEELELLEGPPSTDADWEAPLLRTRVAEADVASVLEQWTGIPSERMLAAEAEKLGWRGLASLTWNTAQSACLEARRDAAWLPRLLGRSERSAAASTGE